MARPTRENVLRAVRYINRRNVYPGCSSSLRKVQRARSMVMGQEHSSQHNRRKRYGRRKKLYNEPTTKPLPPLVEWLMGRLR